MLLPLATATVQLIRPSVSAPRKGVTDLNKGVDTASMNLIKRDAGFTLFEMLVVLAVAGILFGIAGIALINLRNPAKEGQSLTSAALRTVRARAIASTSAYRMMVTADRLNLQADKGSDCNAVSWVRQPGNDVTLPDKAIFKNSAWSVCFNSRGTIALVPSAPLTITDTRNHQLGIQVFLGGAIGMAP